MAEISTAAIGASSGSLSLSQMMNMTDEEIAAYKEEQASATSSETKPASTSSFLGNLFDSSKSVVGDITKSISDIASNTISTEDRGTTDNSSGVAITTYSANTGLAATATNLYNNFKDSTVGKALSTIGLATNPILGVLGGVVSGLADYFSGKSDSFFGAIASGIGTTFTNAISTVGSFFDGVGNFISNLFSGSERTADSRPSSSGWNSSGTGSSNCYGSSSWGQGSSGQYGYSGGDNSNGTCGYSNPAASYGGWSSSSSSSDSSSDSSSSSSSD